MLWEKASSGKIDGVDGRNCKCLRPEIDKERLVEPSSR